MVTALLLALAPLVPVAEVAPPPRAVVHDSCLCAEGDLRCRARAALALQKAAKSFPQVMPSAERIAAQKALAAADKQIKAARAIPH